MTVKEFIERLHQVPQNWDIQITGKRSVQVSSKDWLQYGYIFTDGRPMQLFTRRSVARRLDGGVPSTEAAL